MGQMIYRGPLAEACPVGPRFGDKAGARMLFRATVSGLKRLCHKGAIPDTPGYCWKGLGRPYRILLPILPHVRTVAVTLGRKLRRITVVYDSCRHSGRFCARILNLRIITRACHSRHRSCGLSLHLTSNDRVRLFSFPSSPPQPAQPRTYKLQRLTLTITSLSITVHRLRDRKIPARPVQISSLANGQFAFFRSPSRLPLRLCRR